MKQIKAMNTLGGTKTKGEPARRYVSWNGRTKKISDNIGTDEQTKRNEAKKKWRISKKNSVVDGNE